MNRAELEHLLLSKFPFLDINTVRGLLEISSFRKLGNREVLIRAGTRDLTAFYIVKGMIRGYFLDDEGEEKNVFLRPKGTFTAAPECLLRNEQTKFTFESVLKSEKIT